MINPVHSLTLPRPKIVTAQAARKRLARDFKFPFWLVVLHVPLGVLLYNAGALALLHPITFFFIGMRRALRREEKLESVASVAAYIIGAEVLWRMAQVPIFWEFGKYGCAVIMLTALARRGLLKIPALPLTYFALLLPSGLLTIVAADLSEAKNAFSFNLSGPFLLLASCCFFSQIEISRLQIRKLLIMLILPLITVAVTTLFYTVTTQNIQFTSESNFATSGGFGPNQVSAMLGLGAFLCLTCFLLFKNSFDYKLLFGALAVLFTAQSVLTFSRGGIYTAVGALSVVVLFQLRNLKESAGRMLPIVGLAVIFLLFVFPFLNDFTGGALQERFEDSDSTGRVEIAEADFQVFMENPLIGVGVGNSIFAREKFLDSKKPISHTEFARVVSEHGILGIFALAALFLTVVFNLKRQNSNFGKALVAGSVAWSSLFMLNAGMRLAAPAFIWGLSFLTVKFFALKPIRRFN